MSVPPLLLDLRVAAPGRRRVHIWLPLVLLWPVVLAAGIVALVLAAWVDSVLMITTLRHPRYSRLLWGCFAVAAAARGLQLAIDREEATVHVTLV
jgi:hypothetical protein